MSTKLSNVVHGMDVAKRKLVVLITTMNAGGAERFVANFIDYFGDQFSIHLFVIENQIQFPIDESKCSVQWLGAGLPKSQIIRLFCLSKFAKKLSDFMLKNEISHVFSLMPLPNFIAAHIKKVIPHARVVMAERTCPSQRLKYFTLAKGIIYRHLIRTMYPVADAIIANSRYSCIDLAKNFGISRLKLNSIYNPLSMPKNEVAKVTLPKDKFVFVCVANLRPEKNHFLLLESFRDLRDENTHLALVGKGPELPFIRRTIDSLGILGKVTIITDCNNPYPYLLQADASVLTSNFEGFPNVLLESLQAGLPVISTDVFSGPREILAPGTNIEQQIENDIELATFGILTPVRNKSCLTKAMRLLANDTSLASHYMVEAKNRAKDFDRDDIFAKYKAIVFGS